MLEILSLALIPPLPPIRGDDGDLEFHPKVKANIFSDVFRRKQTDWSPILPVILDIQSRNVVELHLDLLY